MWLDNICALDCRIYEVNNLERLCNYCYYMYKHMHFNDVGFILFIFRCIHQHYCAQCTLHKPWTLPKVEGKLPRCSFIVPNDNLHLGCWNGGRHPHIFYNNVCFSYTSRWWSSFYLLQSKCKKYVSNDEYLLNYIFIYKSYLCYLYVNIYFILTL